jgi:class 3 adenylate cyclase
MVLILLIALYFQEKTKTILPAIFAFIPAVLWHTFMGMSLSNETLFAYFKIIILPIPFIALNRRVKSHRLLIIMGMLLVLGTLVFNVAFHFNYKPLFPMPAQYNFLLGTSVIFALTISLVLMSYYFFKLTALAQLNLEKEKKKSESLLLNVLPAEIADELKTAGRSRPSRFENATVMFSDFYGFHALTENMEPEELITELDLCFSEFDKIIERHNLEKLKTVGHTYMCAAGVPRNNTSNTRDCVLAAIEMIAFIKKLKLEKKRRKQKSWDVRIGINTGPLVAGVIGEKKFVYDIWGDTVNVASRILTTGLPGKINISRSSYDEVKPFFKCKYRGKVMAKNKGLIDQFYVRVRA